jgi:hypothetical protein
LQPLQGTIFNKKALIPADKDLPQRQARAGQPRLRSGPPCALNQEKRFWFSHYETATKSTIAETAGFLHFFPKFLQGELR